MYESSEDSEDILDVRLEGHGDEPRPAPAPLEPVHAANGSFWKWPIISLCLVVLMLAPMLYMLFGAPKARARRHFLRGITFQTTSRFDEAIEEFEKAIRLDRTLAAAGVRLGLARLHLGSPAPDIGYLRDLLQRAMHGDTAALSTADEAFEKALEMAQHVPEGRRFPDQAQPGVQHVRGNAHAGLGLTCVLRASAALGAGQAAQAKAWAREAIKNTEMARSEDPGNLLAPLVHSLAELVLTYADSGVLGIF